MLKHPETKQATSEGPVSSTAPTLRRAPRRVLDATTLEHWLVKTRGESHPLTRTAYAFWKDEWLAHLRQTDGVTRLFSDEFARQDEFTVLTQNGECRALTAVRWLDLAEATARDDSYFGLWPRGTLDEVGPCLIGISSNTIIHSDWRGTAVSQSPTEEDRAVSLATVTVSLAFRRMFESPARFVLAVTRNDRGMNRVAAGLGARKLAQIELHGVPSDIICFDCGQAPSLEPVAEALWERRRVL